jgi:hypothetical protein
MSYEPTPTLAALKCAVAQLKVRAEALSSDMEVLATHVRYLTDHVAIITEHMDTLLGEPQPCPDTRFPELNHHEE